MGYCPARRYGKNKCPQSIIKNVGRVAHGQKVLALQR